MAKFPGHPIDSPGGGYWCDPRKCIVCGDTYDFCPCNQDAATHDTCEDCQEIKDHKNGKCGLGYSHLECVYGELGFICLDCYKLTGDCGCHHCGSNRYWPIDKIDEINK